MNREILARERLDADRRYNDALTTLDDAIVDAGRRAALERADFERIAERLIVFLQQITAFVESKDRELAADVAERVATIAAALDAVAELRTQVNVLQRATRSASPAAPGTPAPGIAPGTAPDTAPGTAPGTSTQHSAPSTQHPAAAVYVAFEDEFRGSDQAIAEKVRTYLPLFRGAVGVIVDLGCGRGELLAALNGAGLQAQGVDSNPAMIAIAREKGVDATHGDALAFLESFPDDALGGVVATQVIEHLEPAYLIRLLATAARKLRAGAPIVLETINPTCWLAFFSSYIRDITHVRAIHPETLQYLLRASGFERVEIRFAAPVPDSMKLKTIDVPLSMQRSTEPVAATLAGMANTINANATILNSLMFTHLDYAAVGFRS
jgi:SAM-dependent methyltransferase